MRRMGTAIASIIFILSLLLGIPNAAMADGEELTMEAEVGFDGRFRMSEWTVITVDIENKGPDVQGDLEVLANQDEGSAVLFSRPVVIPQNSKKRFRLYVRFNSFQKSVDIRLTRSGKEIKTITVKKMNPLSLDKYLLGVMTEDQASLSYWWEKLADDRIFSNYEAVELDIEDLPEKKEGLNGFAVLVINNLNTEALSNKQLEALRTWVEEGGILIIGTGPNGQKTLNGLREWLKMKMGTVAQVGKIPALDTISGKEVLGSTPFQLADLSFDGAEKIVDHDGLGVIWKLRQGAGVIFVSAFDLGLQPVVDWAGNKLFWDNLITAHIDPQRIQELQNPDISRKQSWLQDRFWAIEDALRNIRAMDLPSFAGLLIILLVYLLVIGPVNYLILKKLDKREWAWLTIPAFVILFSAGIYGMGYTRKGSEVITNSIAVIRMQHGGQGANIDTFVGVFIPKRGDYKVTVPDDTLLTLHSSPYGDVYRPGGTTGDQNRIIQAKVVQGNSSGIEFYDAGIWTMRTFAMNKSIADFGELKADLYYQDGKISGQIANHTSVPMEDLVIYTPYSFVYLGDLAVGESKTVELAVDGPGAQGKYYVNRLYQMLDQLYPVGDQAAGTDDPDRQRMAARRNVVQSLIVSPAHMEMGGFQDSYVSMFAFTDLNPVQDMAVNDEKPAKSYYQTLITADLKVSYEKDGRISIPPGAVLALFDANRSQDVFPDQNGYFIDRGIAVFSFDMNPFLNMELTKLQIHVGLPDSAAEVMLRVPSTDESEAIEEKLMYPGGIIELPIDELQRYLREDGKLEFSIEYTERRGVYINVPALVVEGRRP